MRLNINEHYFHAIKGPVFDSIETLSSILRDGYIKSSKDLGYDDSLALNRSDDICLMKYTNSDISSSGISSAFDVFATVAPTLILDQNIEVYRPRLIDREEITEELFTSGLYTDLYDEVRTKNKISTSHIVGFAFPITSFMTDFQKYLFYMDENFYDLAISPLGPLLVDSYVESVKEPSSFIKKICLKSALRAHMKICRDFKFNIPVYDFYLEEEQPVFEHIKRYII